ASLFDGRHMLSYTSPAHPASLGTAPPEAEGYALVANAYDPATHATFSPLAASVVPAPPTAAFGFLRDQHLIGSTPRTTINLVIGWARGLWHFDGGATSAFEATWHYRGPAPASFTINTTIDAAQSPDPR